MVFSKWSIRREMHELDKMIKSFGDELSLYKQSNPLGDALYVKAKDPQQTATIAKKIDTYDYTYDVVYGEGKVEKLFKVLNMSRNVGLVLDTGTVIYGDVPYFEHNPYNNCC